MGRLRTLQGLMRIASIDIGTNTILMLIADVQPDGSLRFVRDEHVIARLGRGVDEQKTILRESFERVSQTLAEYKTIAKTERCDKIFVCGTSALRDARNQKDFLEFIRKRLGLEIRVLSGKEEAELTYRGGVSGFFEEGKEKQFAVLDIGGGSTELTSGVNDQILNAQSLEIGSVRLTERFLKTSPPESGGLEAARDEIRRHVIPLPQLKAGAMVVGVAGTLTTLAAMDLALPVYDRKKVDGHPLALATVQSAFDLLKTKTLEEIRSIPQVLPQ
ncbi:MAG: Ppx/GppA family phosphatase, partial [Bacteroidota bacterium]